MKSKTNKIKLLESSWTNPKKLRDFYESSRNDIIEFMKSRDRPDFKLIIKDSDSNRDVIFIIPTPDISGQNSQNILQELENERIIFVESNGQYFNFSFSCNRGIERAIKENTDWIIICNDDVLINGKIDSVLLELRKTDADVVLPAKTREIVIFKHNLITHFLVGFNAICHNMHEEYRIRKNLTNKGILFYESMFPTPFFTLKKLLSKHVTDSFPLSGHFIAARSFVFQRVKFDETFINGIEDMKLMIDILRNNFNIKLMEVEIDHIGGSSLESIQTKEIRHIRGLANKIYFTDLIEHEMR